MVSSVFKFLSREISGLHQAAYLLGVFAFGSQILALVRDRLLAHYFGAGETLDVYYAAFRIPDFIFVIVASLVSISVLIPFLAERIEAGDSKRLKEFINTTFTFFFLSIIVLSGIIFFLLPFILPLLFAGFSDEAMTTLIVLSRILLLSPILLGISNLFGAITQVYSTFFVYAISPLLYNIGIIIGIVFLRPSFGISGVVAGVIIGAILHMAIQIPFVIQKGLFPRIARLRGMWTSMRGVVTLSVPRTITLSLNHIVILVLLAIASFMVAGSISIFNFSFNLQSVPLSIIGVSYSLAAFPTLARLFSKGRTADFLVQLQTSARHIIFWSVPITVLFIILRAQIVRTVLGSGEFSWTDTRLTAAALALFSLSVVFQGLSLLFTRAYYASGNTSKPLIATVSGMVCTLFSVVVLVWMMISLPMFRFFIESLLRVADVPGTLILALPLAYSIGIIVSGCVLWLMFESDFRKFSKPLLNTFFQTFSASVVMGFVAYLSLNMLDDIFDINKFWGIFLQGFFAGIIGIIVAVGVLLILGNQEIKEIWKTLHRKFWKVKAIAPDAEVMP